MNALIEFQKTETPSTLPELIASSSMKLRRYEREFGRTSLISGVSLILTDISQHLRFDVSLDMVKVAAELIIEDFPDTKIDDFHLFRKKVLSGATGGKLFGWDTRTICETWREYYAWREDAFAEAREDKWRQEKKAEMEGSALTSEQMAKVYAKMSKDGQDKLQNDKLRAKYRDLTLKQICFEESIDYDQLEKEQILICQERMKDFPDIDFDLYLANHMRSIMMEVKKYPERLYNYCAMDLQGESMRRK